MKRSWVLMSEMLHIYIPIYNNASLASLTAESLVKAGVNPSHIFLFDNHSTNELDVLGMLSRRFSLTVNNENLGYDGNIVRCISHCTARFAWIISAGDTVTLFDHVEVCRSLATAADSHFLVANSDSDSGSQANSRPVAFYDPKLTGNIFNVAIARLALDEIDVSGDWIHGLLGLNAISASQKLPKIIHGIEFVVNRNKEGWWVQNRHVFYRVTLDQWLLIREFLSGHRELKKFYLTASGQVTMLCVALIRSWSYSRASSVEELRKIKMQLGPILFCIYRLSDLVLSWIFYYAKQILKHSFTKP